VAKTKSSKSKKKTTKRKSAQASSKKVSKKKTSKKKTASKAKSAKKSTKKKSTRKTTKKKSTKKGKTSKKTGSARTSRAKTAKKVAKRTTKKKAAASKSRAAAAPKKSPSKKKIKTHLKRRELNYFAKLLLLKRAELLGDMDSMHNEALNIDSANLSHMPLHMADIGSDNYEQELTLGLLETERKRLTQINAALERIKDRTYGVCQVTFKPIKKARLEAKPWAKYSIEAARELERTGKL